MMKTILIPFQNTFAPTHDWPEVHYKNEILVLLPHSQVVKVSESSSLEDFIVQVAHDSEELGSLTYENGRKVATFHLKQASRSSYKGWEVEGKLSHHFNRFEVDDIINAERVEGRIHKRHIHVLSGGQRNSGGESCFCSATCVKDEKQVFLILTKNCRVYWRDFYEAVSKTSGRSLLFVLDSGKVYHFDCWSFHKPHYQRDFFQEIFYRAEGNGFLLGHVTSSPGSWSADLDELYNYSEFIGYKPPLGKNIPISSCRIEGTLDDQSLTATFHFQTTSYSNVPRSGSEERTYQRLLP